MLWRTLAARSDGLIPAGNSSRPAFVVVDWGTSSFRGWLMSADGETLAESRGGEGMLRAATARVGLNLEQTDELIMAASKAAVKIMTENIATVRKIADVLEQKKRIEGYEIRKIIRQSKEAARS